MQSNYSDIESLLSEFIIEDSRDLLKYFCSIYQPERSQNFIYDLIGRDKLSSDQKNAMITKFKKLVGENLDELWQEYLVFIDYNGQLEQKSNLFIAMLRTVIKEQKKPISLKENDPLEKILNLKCQPFLRRSYASFIKRIESELLGLNVSVVKKRDTYFTPGENHALLNTEELWMRLVDNHFISNKRNKKVTLENIFLNLPNSSKVIWTGQENELRYFIHVLKKNKIIKNHDYWKIAESLFLNVNSQKFKNVKKVTGKDIPTKADLIKLCVERSLTKRG